MIIYDENGVEHEKEAVDAKECIERLGWTTELPVVVQEEVVDSGSKKTSKNPTEE
jgi:hypothetical protein